MNKSEHFMDNGLTTRHYQLIQHITEDMTVENAALATGISFSTARRWLKLPEVQLALARLRGQVEEVASAMVTRRFEEMAEKAILAIEDCVTDRETPAVRLKAAQLVLDRVAPAQPPTTAQQQQAPGQWQLIDPALASYLTFEELDAIEHIASNAEARRAQAEQDRETLERKRG